MDGKEALTGMTGICAAVCKCVRLRVYSTESLEEHERVEDDVLVLLFRLKAGAEILEFARSIPLEL